MQVNLLDPDEDSKPDITDGASFVSDDGISLGAFTNVSLEVTP